MSVRVRFAPSPTGHVHIGNIRAAIFNWLFARHCNGAFLLRIEDTDRERSTPEACRSLLEAIEWLGLAADEPPLYQSSRREAHLHAAELLLQQGQAYRKPDPAGNGQGAVVFRIPYEADCIPCIRESGPAELSVHPGEPVSVSADGITFAQVSRKGKPMPAGCCLAGVKNLKVFSANECLFEIESHLSEISQGAVFALEKADKLTFMRREVVFEDAVKGELAKPLDGMKDLVIVRSDGNPVFHLANVCDDAFQKITHIIRGDDHVENTFRHLLLFNALGFSAPVYAHLPMIVNASGKPYSKRDGDAYVGDFKERGFCAEALFNYLSLLGWSPGDDREKMTRQEMIDLFTLERVKSAAAQMDIKKLTHLNWMYLSEMDPEAFCRNTWQALGGCPWRPADIDDYFRKVCALMQSRANVFSDAQEWRYFFDDNAPVDQTALHKQLARPGVKDALLELARLLDDCSFDEAALAAALRAAEISAELGEGKLNQPARVAVTGTTRGAGIYETMAVMGRERVMRRLRHTLEITQ